MPERGYGDEAIVPVDIDRLMADEAIGGLPDGPVKRLLTDLAAKMDHDEGQPPPQLYVRRSVVPTEARPGLDYQAAYVALREAVVGLMNAPPVAHYRSELNEAVTAADNAGASA